MPQSIIKTGHAIDWNNAKWVEKDKKEPFHVNCWKDVTLKTIKTSTQYGVGEKAWLRRGNIERDGKLPQNAQHPVSSRMKGTIGHPKYC